MATDAEQWEAARRRRETLRSMLVELMDLDERRKQIDADLAAWQKRWQAAWDAADAALDARQ